MYLSLLIGVVFALQPMAVDDLLDKIVNPEGIIWQVKSSEVLQRTGKTVVVKKGIPLSSQLVYSNAVYVFRNKYDLRGGVVRIPPGCTLDFKCGSRVYNGCFDGEINVKGKYERALNVICQGDILTKDFKVYHVSPEVDRSKIESCINGCIIYEDIVFPKSKNNSSTCLQIRSNLRGKKRTIVLSVDSSFGTGISIEKEGVCISDLTVKKEIPNKWNYRYAITSNKSNIIIRRCNIYGALSFRSVSEDSISSNILLEDNLVISDFTSISWNEKPYDLEKDAITFKSVDDVIIQRNSFEFINVNRGFKLTSNNRKENNKTLYFHYPKDIRIVDNTIKAFTTGRNKSKQLIDCYIGARNVQFSNNRIEVYGFSVIFENKTHVPTHTDISKNYICGNNITTDCRLCFLRTTDKDCFEISDNMISVIDPKHPFTEGESDYFNGNAFCSCPNFSYLKMENNQIHYDGNKSRLYFLVVSSSNRNADVFINNNNVVSMASTVVSGVNSFVYSNNMTKVRDCQYEVEIKDVNNVVVEKREFDKNSWPKYLINLQKGEPSGTLTLKLPDNIDSEYNVIMNPSLVKRIDSNLEMESVKNVRRIKRK